MLVVFVLYSGVSNSVLNPLRLSIVEQWNEPSAVIHLRALYFILYVRCISSTM